MVNFCYRCQVVQRIAGAYRHSSYPSAAPISGFSISIYREIMKMKQAERALRTREKIMTAAMNEFGENGYRGGSIGNICKAGINKGLLYHYFSSKDELYLACVESSCGRLVEELDNIAGEFPVSEENRRSRKAEQEERKNIVQQYMQARMNFYGNYHNESRILFECLLDPPENLRSRIDGIMHPLQKRNLEIYEKLLSGLTLREGMTKERAEKYFILFQYMFNAYFSSPAMHEKSMEERIALHEQGIPEMLDCMLYGIAEKTQGKQR